MKRFLFIIAATSVIAAITTNWAFSQTTIPYYQFYYMKNGKVFYKGEEIFLKTCNYVLRFHRKTENNQLLVGPSGNYFNNWDANYPTTQDGLTKYLHAHFSLIKQMGFNSIRLMHTAVEPRYPSVNGELAYKVWAKDTIAYPITASNRIFLKDAIGYDAWYYYENADGQNLIDYKNAMKLVFDAAHSYDLKIIWVTGSDCQYYTGNKQYNSLLMPLGNNVTNNYIAFLNNIASEFKEHPALFAYDLFHELLSFNNVEYSGAHDLIPQIGIAEVVKTINQEVKETDPNHYTTAGLFGLNQYFALGIKPFYYCDFLNFHTYDNGFFYYLKPEKLGAYIKQNCIHFSTLTCPWMIGEIGIETPLTENPCSSSGSHFGEKVERFEVSEEQQKQFALSTYDVSFSNGAIGYAWWEFQNEQNWNNNGLLKSTCYPQNIPINIEPYSYNIYGARKEIVQTNESSVFYNDPSFTDCTISENDYYNILQYQSSENNTRTWSGKVINSMGTPIPDAIILLQHSHSNDGDNITGNSLKGFYTFTKSDGNYSLTLPEGDNNHARISVSKFGYTTYYEENRTVSENSDIIINSISGFPTKSNYNPTIVVNNNQTYIIDYTQRISQITIKNGGTLIVNDTLFFDENSQLKILPGGKLILNNGAVLTAIHNAWLGIVLSGDFSENRAQIISTGNCIIAKAFQGISAHNNVVIDLKKVDFINNYQDVMIRNNSGATINFNDCNFTLTADALPQYSVSNSCDNFVRIYNTTQAKFVNCHFADERNYPAHVPNKTGIYAYKVNTLEVLPDPFMSSKKSSFDNLKYGIYAISDGGAEVLTVKNTDFKTIRGIYMYAYMNFSQKTITNNNFEILDYSYAIECESHEGKSWQQPNIPPNTYIVDDIYRSYGIYIDEQSNNYKIEGNVFHGVNGNPENKFGIVARNNGPIKNDLYRNNFSFLQNSIQPVGRNCHEYGLSGIIITCNKFNNSKTDIFVTDDYAVSYYGIARNQGSSSFPAGNLFSDDNNLFNIKNDIAHINYFFRNANSQGYNPLEVPQRINGNVSPQPIYYGDLDNTCPDNTSSTPLIDPDVVWGEMNVAEQAENNIDQTLATLTDGGNTPLTVAEVALASDYNAWQTYLSLIAKSPYLSDEVLQVIAGKEYALTAPMVRDVLIANPQAAKDPAIQKILDERIDKLPDYMLEQIKLGMMQMSPKEFLEMQKAEQRRIYENNMLALLNHYSEKADSTNSYNDSIVMVLNHRIEPHYLMLLAQHYFSLGETHLANQTLSDILAQFVMDEFETNEVKNLREYYSFYTSLQVDSLLDMQQLDSTTLELLRDFERKGGIAGTHATALLMLNGASDYREPVYLPEEDISTRGVKSSNNFLPTNNYVNIYPNPADEYFHVEYKLPNEETPLYLTVFDVLGKAIFQQKLAAKQDVVIIITDKLGSGSFTLCISNSKSVIISRNFTIRQ